MTLLVMLWQIQSSGIMHLAKTLRFQSACVYQFRHAPDRFDPIERAWYSPSVLCGHVGPRARQDGSQGAKVLAKYQQASGAVISFLRGRWRAPLRPELRVACVDEPRGITALRFSVERARQRHELHVLPFAGQHLAE